MDITIFLELGIFLITMLGLQYLVFPRINEVILKRQAEINQSIKEIESAKSFLSHSQIEAKNYIIEARKAADLNRMQLQEKMLTNQEAALLKARQELESMKKISMERHYMQLEQERKLLVAQHIDLAKRLARALLLKRVSNTDQIHSIEKTLNELEKE